MCRVAGNGGGEDYATVQALGLSRFDLKYSSGTLAHQKMLASIALIGREVAPRVRDQAAAGGAK